MRTRLTWASALLGLLLVGAMIGFRTLTIADLAAADLRDQLDREARLVATVVAADPVSVDRASPAGAGLAAYAVPDRHVVVELPGGRAVEVAGARWDDATEEDALVGAATVDGVMARVRAPADAVERTVESRLPSLLALGAMLVLLAVLAGALVADRLSRPFVTLAAAAGALARGRLDLRLPRTRVREARAVAEALDGSARRLGDSLRRERDLALWASHELRTPLTALRLELDDLRHRDDVPEDLAAAAEVALARVDRLDEAVGELLEETRSHPVVPGAQLPLAALAPLVVQRWTDALGLARVPLEPRLTGDTAVELTPGPVEQLLDELLADVVARRPERVRLALDGGQRHVRVTVAVEGAGTATAAGGRAALERARAVAETVGGRLTGDPAAPGGLVVLVPRR